MKSKILMMALAASLTACAQVDYHQYDNLYPDVGNGNCITQFDGVINEVGSVRNILVKSNDVVNYYHENSVRENHYYINGRYYNNFRRCQVIPRRVTIPSNVRVYRHPSTIYEQDGYTCLGDVVNNCIPNKWFFFFQLNSDFLTNREELGHLIDYTKANPHSLLYIDAYADAETGNYESNMRISNMRANAIVNILIKEGIERRRLFVKCHGSISQPYKTNNLNRCVTVSAVCK